jgi:(p)ppGpp synthase/HD superfamily hydrolase
MKLRKKLYQDRTIRRRAFENLIAKHFSNKEQRQIMRAYRLAKYGHQRQLREGGQRYFEHVRAVAVLLIDVGVRDADVICAALLHDVIEDTFILLFDDIEEWFGANVCHTVRMVTKVKRVAKTKYFGRLSNDGPRSWLVKCADRVHNISTLVEGDANSRQRFVEKKRKQVKETRKYVLPLARSLSATKEYKAIGEWFVDQLTAWSDLREQEVAAADKQAEGVQESHSR